MGKPGFWINQIPLKELCHISKIFFNSCCFPLSQQFALQLCLTKLMQQSWCLHWMSSCWGQGVSLAGLSSKDSDSLPWRAAPSPRRVSGFRTLYAARETAAELAGALAHLHWDFIAEGHLREMPQTGKQEMFCRAEITLKVILCKWFDLLICMNRSCHVSISGKGNGLEEEWEEKGNRTRKKVGRFHLGWDTMFWVFS